MKKVFLLIVLVGLFISTAHSQEENRAFKTPEAAIEHYFSGLKQNNLSLILEACAIDEVSQRYDFAFGVERLGGVIMITTLLSPTDYPFYQELNKLQMASQLVSQVKLFSLSLLSGQELSPAPIMNIDTEMSQAFIKAVSPERLAKIELLKTSVPNEPISQNPKYIETMTKFAQGYGADEAIERVSLFGFEETLYFTGFRLLRYGENWKIFGLDSPLASTNPLGVAIKTTEDAFENLLKGN